MTQPYEDFRVHRRDVEEIQPHQFVSEACDLGWRGFPQQAPTQMGNGLDFVFVKFERDADGDIVAANYAQMNGCITLRVFND